MRWETISVLLGVCLFLLALRQFRMAYQLSRERGKTGRWVLLGFMVAAFLAGYLAFIQSMMRNRVSGPSKLRAVVALSPATTGSR